jgi:uncharacterized protein YycO
MTRPRIMVAASFLGLAAALGGTAAAASFATAGQPGMQNQSIHSLAGMVDEAAPAMQQDAAPAMQQDAAPAMQQDAAPAMQQDAAPAMQQDARPAMQQD